VRLLGNVKDRPIGKPKSPPLMTPFGCGRCGDQYWSSGSPQDRYSIWHGSGTKARSEAMNLARPAGFDPATRCLEGTSGGRLEVA